MIEFFIVQGMWNTTLGILRLLIFYFDINAWKKHSEWLCIWALQQGGSILQDKWQCWTLFSRKFMFTAMTVVNFHLKRSTVWISYYIENGITLTLWNCSLSWISLIICLCTHLLGAWTYEKQTGLSTKKQRFSVFPAQPSASISKPDFSI